MKNQRRLWVAGILALIAGGCSTSPRLPRADVPDAPAVPVPTEAHPHAYNYLPQVMRYAGSAEELAVYRAWAELPLEQVRDTLEALGIIRDWEMVTQNGVAWERGGAEAVNRRHHLMYIDEYATPGGSRRALIFVPGFFAGSAGNLRPALALVTDEHYVPLKHLEVRIFRQDVPPRPRETADGLEVTYQAEHRAGDGWEVETLRLTFGAERIEEVRKVRRPGPAGDRVWWQKVE
jgi:hypothetical protein